MHVREFELSLGGSGGVPHDGSPIGLGWRYREHDEVELESFEETRDGVRKDRETYMRSGYLSPEERHEALKIHGCADDEIAHEADLNKELQTSRKDSVKEVEDAEMLQAMGQAFMWWWMVTNNLT